MLAYGPNMLWGWYEFPSEANFYFWAISLAAPPIAGFLIGMTVDCLIRDSIRRRKLLGQSWMAMVIVYVALIFFAGAYYPVY